MRPVPLCQSSLTSPILALLNDPRVRTLQRALGPNSSLHLVGGAIRDTVLSRPADDLDFATSLAPQDVLQILENAGIRVIPTGLQHLTLTAVPVMGMPHVEITSFRVPAKIGENDLRLSQDISTDLRYRDFTINALAVDIEKQVLIDPFCGLKDILSKTVALVESRQERFLEDPLRIMRMVRFACTLDFSIDDKTWNYAKINVDKLHNVSVERIRDEFCQILTSGDPVRGLVMSQQLGILKLILPEFAVCFGFEQNSFHKDDVFYHTLETISRTQANLTLRLSALLHDIGKPPTLSVDDAGQRHFYKHEVVGAEMSERILERLKFPLTTIRDVRTLVATHMRPLDAGDGGLRRLLRDTHNLFPLWRQLKEADASSCKMDPLILQKDLATFDSRISRIQAEPSVSPLASLKISGKDILELGIEPGPIIGVILRTLHEEVLDDPTRNVRSSLLERAVELSNLPPTKTTKLKVE